MNRPSAERFFRLVFGAAPDDAAVVVSAFPSGESICLSADNVEGLAAAAEAAEVDRQDAYFSVCAVGTEFDASRGRGKKPDYRAGLVLWADLDVRSVTPEGLSAHKAAPETLPPTVEDAAELLEAVGAEVTAIVSSGHGLHAYWALEAPVIFGPGGGLSAEGMRFSAAVKALQKRIIDAGAAKGWHVDKCEDVPRVLRVPGSSNFKIPGDVRTVEVVFDDGPRHDYEALCTLLGVAERKGSAAPTPAATSAAPTSAANSAAPTSAATSGAAPAVAIAVDIDDVRDRLKNLRNAETKKFFAPILRGESFAKPGERDRMLQRAASLIAFVEPSAPPSALAEILRPSLGVWAAEPGATRSLDDEVAKAAEKIRRAQTDGRRKKADAQAKNERIKALMEGKIGPLDTPAPAEAAPGTAPGAPSDGSASGTAAAGSSDGSPAPTTPAEGTVEPSDGSTLATPQRPDRPSSKPPVAPGFAPFTEAELGAIAADLGCSLPELNRRWIIQHKSAYFVLVDGRYKRPITDRELEVALRDDLARAPVEMWIEKADGNGVRPAKVSEILRKHCTVARTLVSSLSAQRSIYDAETETFTEAVCPIRPLEPKFDPDVQEWLELFFGDQKDKGLDWIATVTDLERYTCALYLSGPPATGKTLLANGLSRMMTVGGPSELGRILENFNEDLMRCALIFADEHIPAGSRGTRTSTELRNLIGNNRRTLNRKFLPQAPLVGAIRLILAANNDRMLAFSEDLSVHDLEAVAERFLHVNTAGAQGYFKKFPGGKAPEDWVEGDVIAQHAMWLRENRAVLHEGRFLVSGSKSRMLSMLATGGRNSGVVEFLAKYLAATPQQRQPVDSKKLVIAGKGEFWVNTLAVADHWDLFVTNDRAPSTTKVGRALAGLSKEGIEKRLAGQRYHLIDHELVLSWMAENQVGSPEDARDFLER